MEKCDKTLQITQTKTNNRTWWAKQSLANSTKRRPTKRFGKRASANQKNRNSCFEKHTFFPGNEIFEHFPDPSPFILSPDSYIKNLWDLVILLLSSSISFTIPFSLSYNDDLGLISFYKVVGILFILDIAVQANTGYSHKGHIVLYRPWVIENYAKTWLFFDVLSGIPIEFFENSGYLVHPEGSFLSKSHYIRYLWLLKLLKSLKLNKTVYKLKYLYAYSSINSLIDFITTSCIVFFVVHISACIFNVLNLQGLEQGCHLNTYWTSSRSRHLHFLILLSQTVTTVGFGNIEVSSITERCASIVLMISTSGLMGYFLAGIKTLISVYNSKQNFYQDLMMKFKKYASHKNLPIKLRRKVTNYFRHLIQKNNSKMLNEEQLLYILSAPLKIQVNLISRGYILMKVNEFLGYSSSCKKALGERMMIEMFAPYDKVLVQGDLTDSLYFIISGKIDIFHQSTGTVFVSLAKGNSFGEISFFTKTPRRASARSTEYSELYSLSRFDYEDVTKNLPKDRERGEVIFRNFSVYGVAALMIKCYFCRTSGHIAPDCPKNKFMYTKNQLLKKLVEKNAKAENKFISAKNVLFNVETGFNKYGIRNVKGKEENYENKTGRLDKLIRNEYLKIYQKKRCSDLYKSESEEEGKDAEIHRVDINESRKDRSSTVFVSTNMEFTTL